MGEARLPEPKDLRRNLILVPSCEKHNNAKARDDSYVTSYIVGVSCGLIGGIADPRTREPFVDRHIENLHRGKHLSETFFGNEVTISTMRGDFNVISPNVEAVTRFATHVAKALYHFEGFKKTGAWAAAPKWLGDPSVIDMHLADSGGTPGELQTHGAELEHMVEVLREKGHASCQLHGPHPEAFHYQWVDHPEAPAMRLVFYKAYRILVLPKGKTVVAG